MCMQKFIFGLVVGVSVCVQAWACEQGNCLELFKKATDKVKSVRAMTVNNGLEMTGRFVVTADNGEVVQQRMEIHTLGDKYWYKTNDYSLYQDGKTMVMIQHEQRSIFLTHPLSVKMREDKFTQLMTLQDSLLKHLTLKDCS